MSIVEIRGLAREAAVRLQGAVTQQNVWEAEIARIQNAVAWSQAMQAIAVAALESAAFGFIGGAIGKLLGARLFAARAPLIAARAIVAGASANAGRRRLAAGTAIVTSLEAARKTGQYLGAVSGALLQVGVKTTYSDQELPDVILTIAISLIPSSALTELGHVKVTRNGRAVVQTTISAWLRTVGADLTLVDLADTGKTLLDQYMTSSPRPADEKPLTIEELRAVLTFATREAAILVAQHVLETAIAIAPNVANRAARQAELVDYMEMTGRFVAFYSEREKDLEYASVNYARASAEALLWNTALRAFVRLEQAVNNVGQGLNLIPGYSGPYVHGGQIRDFQNRAY
jgi:hypothetical protein